MKPIRVKLIEQAEEEFEVLFWKSATIRGIASFLDLRRNNYRL